jgi:HK97 gp10 family phage protein
MQREIVIDVSRALFAGGEMIQTEAQISITAGAVSGKHHRPSAPGEPPNDDTHNLANKIETRARAPLVVEISSNAEYAAPLEFGTSKVAARPYMAPAANKKRREVTKLVDKAVSRAIRRAARGSA